MVESFVFSEPVDRFNVGDLVAISGFVGRIVRLFDGGDGVTYAACRPCGRGDGVTVPVDRLSRAI